MKTGQKIVAILMVLSFMFALVSAALAADDPRINQMTLIFSSKQRQGTAIDKCYASEDFLKDFFGLTIDKVSGNKYKVNGLYYPYTNKIKQYKGKGYFDIETFCKFFGIKYEKVTDTTFHMLESTIPMFNPVDLKGPSEMNYKMGTAKVTVNTYMVKGREFLSAEDLKLTVDDAQKEATGMLKVNNKTIFRWIEKDGKIYLYLKDLNLAMRANQKITKTK